MKLKHWITPLFALGLLFFVSACGSGTEIISRGLRIAVTKIERTSAGAYEVSWQVENPNVVAYVVDHSEHKLYLDGVLVGSVSRKARQGVPVQNKAEAVDALVPVNSAAADKLAQALSQGSAAYRIDSTIWILLADDETAKSQLTSSGTVAVVAK